MSVLTLPFWASGFAAPRDRTAARTDPPEHPAPMPVFIHDAVTPFQGETLLLARLRADLDRALDDQDTTSPSGLR